MPFINLKKHIDEFSKQAQGALILISSVEKLKKKEASCLRQKEIYDIAELVFLKIFLAWEKFLQDIFIDYMLIRKNSAKHHCYIMPRNRAHVLELLKGDKAFPNFTSHEFIVGRAEMYFRRGKPFAELIRIYTSELNDMKCIRNAIAHGSKDVREKFNSLVRSKLGTLPRGMVPGRFLLKIDITKIPPQSFLNFYFETFKDIVHRCA